MAQRTYKLYINGMTEKHVVALCLSAQDKAEALAFFKSAYGREIAAARTWFVAR